MLNKNNKGRPSKEKKKDSHIVLKSSTKNGCNKNRTHEALKRFTNTGAGLEPGVRTRKACLERAAPDGGVSRLRLPARSLPGRCTLRAGAALLCGKTLSPSWVWSPMGSAQSQSGRVEMA